MEQWSQAAGQKLLELGTTLTKSCLIYITYSALVIVAKGLTNKDFMAVIINAPTNLYHKIAHEPISNHRAINHNP